MRILHPFVFFSIKFAGGTSDLMFKIAKAQKKAGLEPIILSGSYKFDDELADSLVGVECIKLRSWLDKFGLSIMPTLIFMLPSLMKRIDVVHLHCYRTFQNLIIYLYFC